MGILYFRKRLRETAHAAQEALGIQFFGMMFLSGVNYGLVSWRRACYRLVRMFWIPVDSPRDRRENRSLEIAGLNSGIGLIMGDY